MMRLLSLLYQRAAGEARILGIRIEIAALTAYLMVLALIFSGTEINEPGTEPWRD